MLACPRSVSRMLAPSHGSVAVPKAWLSSMSTCRSSKMQRRTTKYEPILQGQTGTMSTGIASRQSCDAQGPTINVTICSDHRRVCTSQASCHAALRAHLVMSERLMMILPRSRCMHRPTAVLSASSLNSCESCSLPSRSCMRHSSAEDELGVLPDRHPVLSLPHQHLTSISTHAASRGPPGGDDSALTPNPSFASPCEPQDGSNLRWAQTSCAQLVELLRNGIIMIIA